MYHTATSDSTGHFTMRSVAPGSYKLFAWQSVPAGVYYNAMFLAKFEERGRIVAVTERATATEQVTVVPIEP